MSKQDFTPHHINATQADLAGNNEAGRYILLPGSDGRAKEIAEHFNNLTVKSHSRGHNLYLGTIQDGDKTIDVAAISTGMGCPSIEIILHELFHLGGKRFLRVGTTGSLQSFIKLGDFINAQASVRDEHTTLDYVPLSVPAVASFEFTRAIYQAAKNLKMLDRLHTGTVHCKNSLYAREFGAGPKCKENLAFMNLLADCGVLTTEMETASLFIQSECYNHELRKKGKGPAHRVWAGAVLATLLVLPDTFTSKENEAEMVKHLIQLALESIRVVASEE